MSFGGRRSSGDRGGSQVTIDSSKLPGATSRHATAMVLLLGASAVSLVGTMMSFVTVPWFVMQVTGQSEKVSLSAFFVMLPSIAGGLVGGALTDRFGAKRISVASSFACFIPFCAIFILQRLHALSFPTLLGLIFVGNFAALPGTIARRALLTLLAQRAGWSTHRTGIANSIVVRSALIFGPATAGVLMTVVDPSTVILVEALMYLLSGLIVGIYIDAIIVAGNIKRLTPGTLVEGFRIIASRKPLLQLAVCFGSINIFVNAINFVAIPILARSTQKGSTTLGLTVSVFGAGALVGALLHRKVVPLIGRWAFMRAGLALICLSLFALAGLHLVAVAIVAQFLIGSGTGAVAPFTTIIVTEETPEDVRGRVFGALQFIYDSSLPLVILLFGWFYSIGGTTLIFVTAGTAIAAALVFNVVSLWDATPKLPPAAAAAEEVR